MAFERCVSPDIWITVLVTFPLDFPLINIVVFINVLLMISFLKKGVVFFLTKTE